MLVGVIGSGKSTYCKQKAKEGWITINDDAIVTMLHQDYLGYNLKLKNLYRSIKLSVIEEILAAGQNLIIDSTNLTKKKRKQYIDFIRRHCGYLDIKAICFPIETAEIHAKRRFESDNRGHTYEKWLAVANEQIKMYEKPEKEEGFSDIVYTGDKIEK